MCVTQKPLHINEANLGINLRRPHKCPRIESFTGDIAGGVTIKGFVGGSIIFLIATSCLLIIDHKVSSN